MWVPIACSLPGAEARAQLTEWSALLADSAVSAEREADTVLTFRLRNDLRGLEDLIALARREKACCPFFDFDLAIGADDVLLRISVPIDARDVLDGFHPRPLTP
jgi:hypothetical protein